MKNIWFSIFHKADYKSNVPCFFEPDDYPFSKIICDSYAIINKELIAYLQKNEMQSYFNETMVTKANSWKTIPLKTWDVENYENYKYFTKTIEIIKSIPGLVSASYTLLEPMSCIKAHCGDTDGIFRCHLGLSIPGKIPECGFRVGTEWRSWEEGKLLIFVDANNHEAVNNTLQSRFIFLFDIVRTEYVPKKRLICSTVLTGLFVQKIAGHIKILSRLPFLMQKIVVKIFIPVIYIAIPIRNFIYKIKK